MSKRTVVPNEVWLDRRLSDRLRCVLGVLYSFKGNNDTVWPSREKIAERCGLDIATVSKATTALAKLGWLTKEGAGGKSQATHYTLHVPAELQAGAETVAESATVSRPQTVAESATVTKPRRKPQTVAESASQTVAESATGKELSIEQSSLQPAVKSTALKPGTEEQHAARAEKISLPQPAAETAPTAAAAPAQPAPAAAEDNDDLPDWLQAAPLPPWADYPPPDEQPPSEPPTPPTPPAPPAPAEDAPPTPAEDARPTLALTAPAKKQKPLTQKQAKKLGLFVTAKKPEGVSDALWHDWYVHRKNMKNPVAITEGSMLETYSEAEKDGITVAEALLRAMRMGWRNYNAQYYRNHLARQQNDARAGMTYDEINAENNRRQFEEMTGRRKPAPAFDGVVIDAPARTVENGEQFLLEKSA